MCLVCIANAAAVVAGLDPREEPGGVHRQEQEIFTANRPAEFQR